MKKDKIVIENVISIVLPIYNEEKNVPLVYERIVDVFGRIKGKYQYEIVFVDDGSKDASWEIIKGIASQDEHVRGISFSRNFGHQPAIEAGLKSAKGRAVITMDSDLQHPPEVIFELLSQWENGFKIVNTRRLQTANESTFKKVTSRIFYALINKISDITIEPGSADFRLLDRTVVDELNKLPEKDKFYRGLVNWLGFKSTSVDYDADERLHGQPSYTSRKMLSFARVGITSFSMLPMKIIILIGIVLFLSGFLLLAIMLYYRYFIDARFFSGPAILAAFIIANNGLIILLIGIISIYQITMFKELKNRPNFIISEKTGDE